MGEIDMYKIYTYSIGLRENKKEKKRKEDFLNLRGAYDKFPDFFRMGTFIDSTLI